ncbi:MAG: CPBP family intramembrane metalloprotease [Saprospiraceae bacterium]|nr:CPBP family intramembrane metalloprotease [Saprospiraceae bacterium]
MHANRVGVFRPPWQFLNLDWRLGLILVLLWGLPRIIVVLSANKTGNYQYVSLIFVTMIVLPFLLLNQSGRHKIGISRPRWKWLVSALFIGISFSVLMFLLADVLYGYTVHNWYVYISRSFSNIPSGLSSGDRSTYFVIYAIISMTFSPIGEELFYRGLVHECFANSWGERAAQLSDSLAFSLPHLAHFGIVFVGGSWQFWPGAAALWVILLFLLSLLFSFFRSKSQSVFGSIVAHAGFNLSMTYIIFYYILP